MASPKNVKLDGKVTKGPLKLEGKLVEKVQAVERETARVLRAEQEAVRVVRPAYETLGMVKAPTTARWWWPFGGREEVLVQDMRVSGQASMQANMQEVRAGVLQNMESLSQQGGAAVRGAPFKNIMLPQVRKMGLLGRMRAGFGRFFGRLWGGFWRFGVMVAIVLLVVLWWQGREVPPAQVLGRGLVALRGGDVVTVQRQVDVRAVAGSVVSQVFAMPTRELALLPESLAAMVREERRLADFESFVKPGLVEGLSEEFLASVEQGEVVRGGMLGQVWAALGGAEVRVEPAKVAMRDERLVVMELPLRREDLNVSLPLQVVLDRGADGVGAWQVVDVPNFGAVLGQFGELAQRQAEIGRQGMMVEVLEPMAEIEPAAGPLIGATVVSKRAVPGGIELTMRVRNNGAEAVRELPLWVGFGDARGRCLWVFKAVVPEDLAAGEERLQRWRVAVPTVGKARFVRSLPLAAMRVEVRN